MLWLTAYLTGFPPAGLRTLSWAHYLTPSAPELEAFLFNALSFIKLVSTPEEAVSSEQRIRDPKDRPILRAALNAHADLFLTGDKDFLESSVTDPRIISVADFLTM